MKLRICHILQTEFISYNENTEERILKWRGVIISSVALQPGVGLGLLYNTPPSLSIPILEGERPAAAHLLKSWVRIPPGAWIFVCCECRVLSGRGLCDVLITRPEESYRLCCVVVCDLETSRMGAAYIYDVSRLRVK